jgi:hypothetical protein
VNTSFEVFLIIHLVRFSDNCSWTDSRSIVTGVRIKVPLNTGERSLKGMGEGSWRINGLVPIFEGSDSELEELMSMANGYETS